MNRLNSLFTLSALSLVLAGCAHDPNPNLEQARADYAALQSKPQAQSLAAQETKEAGTMLRRAEQAYEAGHDQVQVDHLAYLADRRIDVANETILQKSAEEALEQAPAQRTQAQLDARNQQVQILMERLQAKQTQRGTVITLGDVLFQLDRAELTPNGMQSVRELGNYLLQHPDRQVVVEGFTDSTGSRDYNLRLSQARADSVRSALVAMGVNPRNITTHGFGQDYPVASNDTVQNRALNRRVEVTIANDSAPVPPRR